MNVSEPSRKPRVTKVARIAVSLSFIFGTASSAFASGVSIKTLPELALSTKLPTSCRELQALQELEPASRNDRVQQQEIELKRLIVKRFDACHADLLHACYPQRKPVIAIDELTALYEELKDDARFKMKTPQNSCFARAYLLAKHLTEKGYKVKTVNIEAPAIIGIQNNEIDVTAHPYAVHGVVTIAAQEPDGRVRKYVLDPQFEDGPVEESEYIRRAIGLPCTRVESDNSKLCFWQEGEPTQVLGPLLRSAADDESLTQLRMTDACGWSMESEFLRIIEQGGPAGLDPNTKDIGIDSDEVSNAKRLQARVLRRQLQAELERAKLHGSLPGRRSTIESQAQLDDVRSILRKALSERPEDASPAKGETHPE